MGALTVFSTSSDGHLMAVDLGGDYDAAHDSATANGELSVDGQTFFVGQTLTGGDNYRIYRAGLFFDTSALPDGAIILSAVLSLYGNGDFSSTDFDITVVSGADLDDPMVVEDYGDLLDDIISMGTFDTTPGFSTSAYNDIVLNAIGLAAISKTGTTKFALRSSIDIGDTPPTIDEFVSIWANEKGSGFQPKLVITYVTTADLSTLWQEGTKIHIIDENGAEQSWEGTFIAHHVSPQPKPHLWFQEFLTSFLLYIDEANVDRRRLDGTATGVTGQPKGTLWVEGANLNGIDVDGEEQYI